MISLTTKCGKSDTFRCALTLAFALVAFSFVNFLSAQEKPLFPIRDAKAQKSILELSDSQTRTAAFTGANSNVQDDPFVNRPLATRPAQDPEELPPMTQDNDPEVLMRGPLHEAFADVHQADPKPNPIVDKAPPEPINELPPEYKPEGENVEWIPGYWAWDEGQSDYIWISGVYRDVPPNQRWVPGYWEESATGFRWVSGFWTSLEAQQLNYLPTPPQSLDRGPSITAPGDDYFYCPGNWEYQNNNYVWRTGHWQPRVANWIWIPARYVWTPRGCIYRPGFWDYEFDVRGTAFAPIYFPQPTYLANNYFYRPRFSINTGANFFVHLFVRPNYSHYFYGNWYGSDFSRHGYRPWVSPHSHYRHYDPLLAHYNSPRYRHDHDLLINWVRNQHRHYNDHDYLRPRNTLNAYTRWSKSNHDHKHDDHIQRTKLADNYRDVVARQNDRRHDHDTRQQSQREQLKRNFVRVDQNAQRQHDETNRIHQHVQRARQQVEHDPTHSKNVGRDILRQQVDKNGKPIKQSDPSRAKSSNRDIARSNQVDLPKINRPQRPRAAERNHSAIDNAQLTRQQIEKAQRDVERATRQRDTQQKIQEAKQRAETQRQQRDAARQQSQQQRQQRDDANKQKPKKDKRDKQLSDLARNDRVANDRIANNRNANNRNANNRSTTEQARQATQQKIDAARRVAQQRDIQRQQDKMARARADAQRRAESQAKLASDQAQRNAQRLAQKQKSQADAQRRAQQRAQQDSQRRAADQAKQRQRQQEKADRKSKRKKK